MEQCIDAHKAKDKKKRETSKHHYIPQGRTTFIAFMFAIFKLARYNNLHATFISYAVFFVCIYMDFASCFPFSFIHFSS